MKKGQTRGSDTLGSGEKKPQHRSLQQLFEDKYELGWEILDCESAIYTEMDVSMEKITHLTALYMKIIERLNSAQDPREAYFTFKMQKLMSEPYIIRCFNNQYEHKRDALENKRKEIEQKVQQEAERQNHRKVVQQVLTAQEQKERRLKEKINEIVVESDKKLQERIKRRAEIREYRVSTLSPRKKGSSLSSEDNYSPISFSNGQDDKRDYMDTSREFELSIDEEDRIFRNLRREIEEQQQNERIKQRLARQGREEQRQE